MSRRRGSIEERPTGWLLRPYAPPDPLTGTRRTPSRTCTAPECETRADAERALTKWQAEIDAGLLIDRSEITVAGLLRRWLQDAAPRKARASSLADYRAVIENHVNPRIGTKRAQDLKPSDIDALWARMAREEVGARTVELAYLRLSQALTWAVSIELVTRNVCAGLRPAAPVVAERYALSYAESQVFLGVAEQDHYDPVWLLYLSTGVRRGEGLGVRWRDLDLDAARLSVRQQVRRLTGTDGKVRPTVTPHLKGKASRRTLDLDPRLVGELLEHRAKQEERRAKTDYWQAHDLVFCTRNGLPLDPMQVSRRFRELRETCGLPPEVTLHCLRHSHTTHCIEAGMSIVEVARRLGHADPSITLRVYGHLLPGADSKLSEVWKALGVKTEDDAHVLGIAEAG